MRGPIADAHFNVLALRMGHGRCSLEFLPSPPCSQNMPKRGHADAEDEPAPAKVCASERASFLPWPPLPIWLISDRLHRSRSQVQRSSGGDAAKRKAMLKAYIIGLNSQFARC
jgi:hypothetical protein